MRATVHQSSADKNGSRGLYVYSVANTPAQVTYTRVEWSVLCNNGMCSDSHGKSPNIHLDGLDFEVEGNQGKDEALQDDASVGENYGPDVAKLALRSCTR